MLLAWYSQFISPSSVYIVASTEGILMVVMGGVGTLLGPVLGATVIVLIKSLLSTYVARWPMVMGLIFILVVLFARDGMLGAIRGGWARLGRRRPESARPAAAGADGAVLPAQPAIGSEEERIVAQG